MSNEIKTRPLTPTEQKYTYAQSMQLEGQTGTIGHMYCFQIPARKMQNGLSQDSKSRDVTVN